MTPQAHATLPTVNVLPGSQILMAVKMVNSDMMRIFKSMKECQQFQHTNVVNDFKRQMLQEAHCLGQNVKSLFETVNTAMAVAKTM